MMRRKLLLFSVMAALMAAAYFQRRGDDPSEDPLAVVRSYMQAHYARDYGAAYRLIASADQRTRDEASYMQAQDGFTGFTLEVARRLAALMDLTIIEQSETKEPLKLTVGYRVPARDDLGGLAFHWDTEKLNGLSPDERRRVLETLEAHHSHGKLVALEGRETFQLVREGRTWRIFHDWGSGTKVSFRAAVPEGDPIQVTPSPREIFTKGDEPFQVSLRVKNRGSRPVTISLNHGVEPREAADAMAMIECGLTGPVPLAAGTEQEFSMAYLLDQGSRSKTKELTITYAFEITP